MKVYHYPKCSTCQRALKFLQAHEITFEPIDIVKQPPLLSELRSMLKHYKGDLRKLFNTSGILYREMKLKDKLPQMDEEAALELLAAHGMLIRRPFLLGSAGGCVGFKEKQWMEVLGISVEVDA